MPSHFYDKMTTLFFRNPSPSWNVKNPNIEYKIQSSIWECRFWILLDAVFARCSWISMYHTWEIAICTVKNLLPAVDRWENRRIGIVTSIYKQRELASHGLQDSDSGTGSPEAIKVAWRVNHWKGYPRVIPIVLVSSPR